jgi:hypothetical protein
MERMLILKIVLILFLGNSVSYAQDTDKTESEIKFKYGIGGGAGFATGYGLSFRYIPKKFGGQVNFAPYKDKETNRYSIGVTFIYMLIEGKISNFFLYQANHYYYNSQMIYTYDPVIPDKQYMIRSTERYFNNGLGFGMEIIMVKRVGLNLMAGYAFYDNFQQLNITAETALYYKF